MKHSIFAELYRRLGEGLGLLEETNTAETGNSPSTSDVKRALTATRRLRANAQEMKLDLTHDDVVRLCREGRR